MEREDLRNAVDLSAEVDSLILLYDLGNAEEAIRKLFALGFKASQIHRILKQPEQRRKTNKPD